MSSGTLRLGEPAAAGLTPWFGRRLDEVGQTQLQATGIPGAAVLVACHGLVVHHGCYGWAQQHDENGPLPAPRRVEPDTMFDVASITKVVATTAIIMALHDRGALRLDDSIERHLPRPGHLAGRGIRISHLLEHRAGLQPWQPLYLCADDKKTAIDRICRLQTGPVGRSPVYSDLGMMLLGAIAEHATDAPLDRLVQRFVTGPLGMSASGYRPDATARLQCAATSTGNPTEQRMIATNDPVPVDASPEDFSGWRTYTLVGEANDGNAAHAFDGVAGHAGLFSTATDLAVFGQTLLQAGRYGDERLWQPETVARFTSTGAAPGQALGFWRRRLHALTTGLNPDHSYGHRGFTGCELVVDPERRLVLVLLSNRLHTDHDPPTDDSSLWRDVARTVLSASRNHTPR